MAVQDLQRASVNNAKAIFIMCDKQSTTAEEEDTTNLLISLAIAQQLESVGRECEFINVPRVLVEVILPQSRAHLASFTSSPSRFKMAGGLVNTAKANIPNFSVMCILELKLAMIAQSCLGCPGLNTLICNLCRSSEQFKSDVGQVLGKRCLNQVVNCASTAEICGGH